MFTWSYRFHHVKKKSLNVGRGRGLYIVIYYEKNTTSLARTIFIYVNFEDFVEIRDRILSYGFYRQEIVDNVIVGRRRRGAYFVGRNRQKKR